MNARTIDGEIETTGTAIVSSGADQSLAVALSRAEIDHQITTARAYPRSIDRAVKAILTLATLDEATAESNIYALPRGGKPIQGPSVRLAEIISSQWGNCRVAARVVHVDRFEKFVEAEGIFHDLETNTATTARVRRRIVDSKGRLFTDDMIIVTGNAACSIAKRNAVLAGVPKGVWNTAYERSISVVAGTTETLSVTRQKAIAAFANFGVKPEQIFVAIGVAGPDDITLAHVPTLKGMFSALKNGEATVEEMFSGTVPGVGRSAHEKVENPLSDTPPPSKPVVAHSSPVQADVVEVDADTGELLDAVHEAEIEQEALSAPDGDGFADEFGVEEPKPDPNSPEGILADFKALLKEAETLEAVDKAKAQMAPLLNGLDGGNKARARDLIADARQRIGG